MENMTSGEVCPTESPSVKYLLGDDVNLEQKEGANTLEGIKSAMSNAGVNDVRLQFCDVHGREKAIYVGASEIGGAVERGVGFDGSSIEGFGRIEESDMVLKPDLSTFKIEPWQERGGVRFASIICNVHVPNGDPAEVCSRNILNRALQAADEAGFDSIHCGPEYEYFYGKNQYEDGRLVGMTPYDRAGYFDAEGDSAAWLRALSSEVLRKMGFVIEAHHKEVAVGQQEVDFKHDDAMVQADRLMIQRRIIKTVAGHWGIDSTDMPKPFAGENGNGLHVNMSAFKDGKNLFAASNGAVLGLSETGRHFSGGLMAHSKGLTAVANSAVNSYHRLVPGYEAPVNISIAQQNRSSLYRVPNALNPIAARIEKRNPDAKTNAYVLFALMIVAGLDGVKNKIEPSPIVDNVDTYKMSSEERAERGIDSLPGSLGEALDCLEMDKCLRGAMGEHYFEMFVRAKRAEIERAEVEANGVNVKLDGQKLSGEVPPIMWQMYA